MRLMPLLMLALMSCSSAGGPASKPAAAGLETLLPPGAELPPITLATQNAPAVVSASPVSSQEAPVYTRSQMALVLAGVELEKGDIAAARDKALERAKLSEVFAQRLQAELVSAQSRAAWLPWVIGGAAALGGALVGLVVGAVVESNKRTPPATPGTIQNPPLELQAGWQRAAGW